MIESLPPYVNWVFALTTILTVLLYLYALRVDAHDKGSLTLLTKLTAILLFVLLGVHAALALNGFYLAKTNPPRFPLGPFPTIIILLVLFFALARESVSVKSLQVLTLLSVMRVPVELVLLWLYQHGDIPQLMTLEGRNFDILSGLTAPLVAWIAFRGAKVNGKVSGKVNRPLLIVWNVCALGLLLNIMMLAILALETPFQKLAFDQPNRGVLYFPFIWLPAIIVPIVFASHVISLWLLLKHRGKA